MSLNNVSSRYRSGALDLLRFLAVLIVYFGHYADSFNYFYQIVPENLKYHPVTKYGNVALLIFFTVSGYVVTMTSIKRNSREFWISRVSRIYPLFWISCIVAFLLPRFVPEHTLLSVSSFKTFLANLTMFPSLIGYQMINPIFHTLLAELIFYTFIGIIIAFRLWNKVLFIILGLTIYCLFYTFSLEKSLNVLIPPYLLGMIFYLIKAKYDKPWKLYSLMALNCICLVSISRILTHDLDLFYSIQNAANFWVMLTLIISAYFFIYLIAVEKIRIKSTKVSFILGQITYPFYLFHIYFFYIYWYFRDSVQSDLLLFGLLFLILIISWLLHKFIELKMAAVFSQILTSIWNIFSKPDLKKDSF